MIFETVLLIGGGIAGGAVFGGVKPYVNEWVRKVLKREPLDHSLDEFGAQAWHPFDCCRCPRCDLSFDAKTLPSTVRKIGDMMSSAAQAKREKSIIPMLMTAIKPDTINAVKTATKKAPTILCDCVECPCLHYHLYCPTCEARWMMKAKSEQ